ncbi:MAG: hypothetical protein N2Z72_01790 [Bacteroidales bacterium]|nr:hypothetical protein [Bacteroidales bacterium]
MKRWILYIFAITPFLFSCKEKGCTNPEAINFCPECKSDNDKCIYEQHALIWFDTLFANYWQANGVQEIKINIFDPKINQHVLSKKFFLSDALSDEPTSCDDPKALKFTYQYIYDRREHFPNSCSGYGFSNPSSMCKIFYVFVYSASSQQQILLDDELIVFSPPSANVCHKIRITWNN